MTFEFSHRSLSITRESDIVSGDWWSGILRQCPKNRQGYKYSLQWKDATGAVYHRHFLSAESVEQFMDELDYTWGAPDSEFTFYPY